MHAGPFDGPNSQLVLAVLGRLVNSTSHQTRLKYIEVGGLQLCWQLECTHVSSRFPLIYSLS